MDAVAKVAAEMIKCEVETTKCEVWLAVNAAGDYVAATDEGNLKDVWENDIGEWDGSAMRVVKMTVTVPLPKPAELTGAVPAEPDAAGELAVA